MSYRLVNLNARVLQKLGTSEESLAPLGPPRAVISRYVSHQTKDATEPLRGRADPGEPPLDALGAGPAA